MNVGPVVPDTLVAAPVAEANAESGQIDQAAAARYRQAQTELVGLIREEARTVGQEPEVEREVLPDSLADWLGNRVAELEQAEAGEPAIDPAD